MEFGRQALDLELARDTDLMIVDEIGPWELSGQGWAEPVTRLVLDSDAPMIWAVQRKLVEKAIAQ
jgi:nucleoside-triphosphatase